MYILYILYKFLKIIVLLQKFTSDKVSLYLPIVRFKFVKYFDEEIEFDLIRSENPIVQYQLI